MKKLCEKIKDFFYGAGQCNVQAHAAAGAFYMFLSLVPFVSIATAIIPYTGLSQEQVLNGIAPYIPDALENVINSIIDDVYFASGIILPLSILFSVYLTSRVFASLIRGLEVINGNETYSLYWSRMLRACIFTVLIFVLMVIILAMLVFGRHIMSFISGEFPFISPFLKWLIKLRLVLIVLILTLAFTVIYKWVPEQKLKYPALLPGAFTAAVSWLLFTWIFSLFLTYGGAYSTYGSLATIVITLMWMYYCMYIILLGEYINLFIRKRKTDEQT